MREQGKAATLRYAPGTGKAKNKLFMEVQEQVLLALLPYEDKLHCLCDSLGGSKYLHPLSPRVRQWHLSLMRVNELIDVPVVAQEPKKKNKSKIAQKENPDV